MQVTLINKTDTGGGAAVACLRLYHSLLENQIDTRVLVEHKQTDDECILSVTESKWKQFVAFKNFVFERLSFLPYEASKEIRFQFSLANFGTSIHNHSIFKKNDIIHLHWINQGYLSLNEIARLAKFKRPMVWTMHDMWAFTGGCHYSGDCRHFEQNCGNCSFLKSPKENDLSNRLHAKKAKLFEKTDIVFVACSQWLAEEARKSSLLKGKRIEAIPNPIDTDFFKPLDKKELRKKYNISQDKKIILFGSVKVADRRKGYTYLKEAIKQLLTDHPEWKEKVELILFGKQDPQGQLNFGVPVHPFAFIDSHQKMVELYNLADVYVLPSIQDNLPNTAMESLACSVPVVAFNTGGLPEMIDHKKTGYLAQYKSSKSLAEGIDYVLANSSSSNMPQQARELVLERFSNETVAQKYIDLYLSLLKQS